jgi:hypothetical protein
LYGSDHFARASFSDDLHDDASLHLRIVTVDERTTRQLIWHCTIDPREGKKRIHDDRGGNSIYTKEALTGADRSLLTCPIPDFGEFDGLVRIVLALLRSEGYGEIT